MLPTTAFFTKHGPGPVLGVCLLLAASIMAAELTGAGPAELEPAPHFSRLTTALVRSMTRQHLLYRTVDDTISRRTWTNYLAAVDPDRVYFLASDIERFRAEQTRLDDALLRGNTQFAFDVFAVFRERLRDRVNYVKQVLDAGIDFQEEEFYRPDRTEAAWPQDTEAWDELWRRKVKNEWLEEVESLGTGQLAALAQDREANAQPPIDPAFLRTRYAGLERELDRYDADRVLEKYLTAFARAFDPHSGYLSPVSRGEFDAVMTLSLVGVGAVLQEEGGEARIAEVLAGGPAARNGNLKVGDRLVAVGEAGRPPVDVRDRPVREIVSLVRGEAGSRVVLGVVPASEAADSNVRWIELVREEVPFPDRNVTVRIAQVQGETARTLRLGIVIVPAFFGGPDPDSKDGSVANCVDEVRAVLTDLQAERIDGLLLDFRHNWGGYMHWGVDMTGLFLEGGPIGRLVDRRGRSRILRDPDSRIAYAGPLVILVNRFSGSEPEVMAGTLQDYGRAVIVGDSKTYGKGTAQYLRPLSRRDEFGAANVTETIYYRVSGASQQLKGVTPDIVIPSTTESARFGEECLVCPIGWSSSKRVKYTPVADLGPVLRSLRRKSAARTMAPHFTAYKNLLRQLHATDRRTELPLRLTSRLARIRQVRELQQQMATLVAKWPFLDKGSQAEHDPVLDESLKILVDLVNLQPAAKNNF